MKRTCRFRFLLPVSLLILLTPTLHLSAQDAGEGGAPDTGALLQQALLVTVEMTINSADREDDLWSNTVSKITIPGRSVEMAIESGDSRLSVSLTPYPTESESLLLVARNETWTEGNYSNGLTTLPVAYGEEVYYYPLGRAGSGNLDNPVEVRMVINVVPYLDTLDEEARSAVEAAFDSSSRFDLSGESN